MEFCGRVVPSGITLSFAFGGKYVGHGHHSPGKQFAKLRGYGGWPPAQFPKPYPERKSEGQAP